MATLSQAPMALAAATPRGSVRCAFWGGNESDRGRFLEAAQAGACHYFGTTLGPNYNAAHANHFHFGLRGFGICR